jgi:Nif-specific regulatory protein
VRELENCIERAIILSTDGAIESYHLPPQLQISDGAERHETRGTLKNIITNMEREVIVEELKRTRGNMAQAARSLGITERMMGIRVEKYRIETARFK